MDIQEAKRLCGVNKFDRPERDRKALKDWLYVHSEEILTELSKPRSHIFAEACDARDKALADLEAEKAAHRRDHELSQGEIERLREERDHYEEAARLARCDESDLLERYEDLEHKLQRVLEEREDLRVLVEVRGRGCACGDDEACVFVRERDAALTLLEEKCGKAGCSAQAISRIMGDLTYYACQEHREEIEKLTENE